MVSKHKCLENRLSDGCAVLKDVQCRYPRNAVEELRVL